MPLSSGFSDVASVQYTVLNVLFYSQASRKWLENLYPSSDKRQRTADNVTKRAHGMTEAEVEKRVGEVVVARFYSLAKVNLYLTSIFYVRRREISSSSDCVNPGGVHFNWSKSIGSFSSYLVNYFRIFSFRDFLLKFMKRIKLCNIF